MNHNLKFWSRYGAWSGSGSGSGSGYRSRFGSWSC
jgi:hypothetical protein